MKRVFGLLKLIAVTAVLGTGTLLAWLLIERRSEVTLPEPTGPFKVGRTLYDWVDDKTPDAFAPKAGTKRELLVWIWYPADPGKSDTADHYRPALLLGHRVEGSRIIGLLTRDFSKVHGHSFADADVSAQRRSYPIVIMRAGASAEIANYSTLAEDLASHGYIVVGFDAPYRTSQVVFPDGRVVERGPENNPELVSGEEFTSLTDRLLVGWTTDTAFVFDRLEQLNSSDAAARFTGRLDLARVGMFGHSFGGATAAQFCSQDSRCKAVLDLDGSLHGGILRTGIQKPFLFLMSGEGDFSSTAEVGQILADIQSVYDRLPPESRLRVSIRGANHLTFSDDGALLKSSIVRGALRMFGKLRIDGRRQLAVTAYCIHTFFDAYLGETSVSRPLIASPLYPEIQILE